MACRECGAENNACVRRSAVNHRVHQPAALGQLNSTYWTAAHLVAVGADGVCQTCRRHVQVNRGPEPQMDLLGEK